MTSPKTPSIKNASNPHQRGRSKTARRYDQKTWNTIYREYRAGQLSISEISLRFGPASCTIVDRAKRRGWGERDLSHKVRQSVRAKLAADALFPIEGKEDHSDVPHKPTRSTTTDQLVASDKKDGGRKQGEHPGAVAEEPSLKTSKPEYSDRKTGAAGAHEDKAIIEAAGERGAEVVRRHRRHLRELHAVATKLLDKLKGLIAGTEMGFEVPIFEFGKDTGKTRVTFPFLGKNESVSDALAKVSQATARVVPLERQAFNLDDRDSEDRDRVRLEDRLKTYAEEEQEQREKGKPGLKVVPFKPRPMDDVG